LLKETTGTLVWIRWIVAIHIMKNAHELKTIIYLYIST